MGNSIKKLGDVISGRIKSANRASQVTYLELGTINADLSLKIDGLNGNIRPNDYMVSLNLTHETYFTYNELNSSTNAPHVHSGGQHSQEIGDGAHTHSTDGLHDHRVPSVFRRLKAGDRVLVAWVGNEPIIVDIVVAGTTITKN